MAKKKDAKTDEEIAGILRDLLILQLGVAKVSQNDIRKIVGCGMGRVTEILKHLPRANH